MRKAASESLNILIAATGMAPMQRQGKTQAEETDYDNFKSKVAYHQGKAGTGYSDSLHEVWSTMRILQD